MKYTRQMLIAAALMVMPMLATAQFGQTVSISTEVPFEFVVGDRVVPAGKCVLQAANAAGDTILIRNDDKMVRLFSATSLGDASNIPASNQLVFHKYGERYFLAAVRVQGTRIMYWLPEGKQETRLRQQDQSSAEETIHAF
ncbi:MAG: hypothetical protein ACM3WP_10430 [Acidobacteriota bacterium]